MKKVILLAAVVCGFSFASAQMDDDGMSSMPTAQGNFLVEMNTGFGSAGVAMGSGTGIGFSSWKYNQPNTIEGMDPIEYKHSEFTIGAEGGYFVADNFAVKAGLGYVNVSDEADTDNSKKETYDGMSWMLGSKYYVNGMFPLQLDLRGTNLAGSIGDVEDDQDDPLWIGFQAGYAWFLNDYVAIEPGLKYNLSLSDYSDSGAFEFRVGFVGFF